MRKENLFDSCRFKSSVYAHVASLPQHEQARGWLDAKLSGTVPVGLCWPALLGFVRLVSNARIFEFPEPVCDAWKVVEAWLQCEAIWVPHPTDRHSETLSSLMKLPGMRANLVSDAHLAALAIEHGLLLCSTDGDFARFPGLRWMDPLRDTADVSTN